MREVFMRKAFAGVLFGVVLLAGCQSDPTTEHSAVGVDRQQRFMVSSEEVDKGSAQAYQEVLAAAQKQGALDKDAATLQRVKTIVGRLIPATGALRADAPKWAWEAHVLSSKEVNAWCMAGGKIAVYTGLIEQLKPSDDELAAVLGHEMGHALREHVREQASRQMGEQVALGVVGAIFNVPDIAQQLAPMILDVTFNLPHSRGQETEADRVGVELAARAGYDPRAAISLWQKMEKIGGAQPPKFLSTHPASADREKDLQAISQKVLPLYQAAKGGSPSAGK
jgi:predicted Zn-dependent protease